MSYHEAQESLYGRYLVDANSKAGFIEDMIGLGYGHMADAMKRPALEG
jgi:hypothetical protein